MNESLLQRVELALDELRDYLRADGGDVQVARIREDMVVELEWVGNCQSCSISRMTRAGIEEAIRRVAPEVKGVVALND